MNPKPLPLIGKALADRVKKVQEEKETYYTQNVQVDKVQGFGRRVQGIGFSVYSLELCRRV